MNDQSRLKLYIVSSHMDKGNYDNNESKYNCPIQAGAALTDKRICNYNDYDDCDTNISARNKRYCEASAMYWIGKHIESDYIGILHYRRRFNLTDADYEKYMDEGVDIITATPINLGRSIEDHYRNEHYSCDWDLLMDLLKKHDPTNFRFAQQCFKSNLLHPCNINVFRNELYHDFCEWAFPILNDFYLKSPVKTDIYDCRDVGFICERLSHLFVSKCISEGFKIIEADLVNQNNSGDNYLELCKDKDADYIYEYCNTLYKNKQIRKCAAVISAAHHYRLVNTNKNLADFSDIIYTGILERQQLPLTLHEYLPENCRSDLSSLLSIWNMMRKALAISSANQNEETAKIYNKCLSITGFSDIAISIMKQQIQM